MSRSFSTITALAAAVLVLSIAAPVQAVDSTGGLGSTLGQTISGMTFIDLVRGATGSGTFSQATVIWENGPSLPSSACQFVLKFYRPDASGTKLHYLDETEPIDAASGGVTNVTLTSPVTLLKGDVVGITELGAGPCGGVSLATGGGNATLSFPGDSGTSDVTLCDQPGAEIIPQTFDVIVRTSGTTERAGVVLVGGSVQGAQGSNFKTSMQLVNPGTETIEGFLVFHRQGQPGSPNDPSSSYLIPPQQTVSYADAVATIGGNGVGSIDVMADSTYAPLVLTRIYNDAGSSGTTGVAEAMVRPGDNNVIETNQSAWLVAPADPAKFRMNVAVRSLLEGASLTILVFGPDGTPLGSTTKSYPPDEFDLESVGGYLGSLAPPANGLIEVQVTAGRAIVAGITVDNTTNDTALQLGTRNHF